MEFPLRRLFPIVEQMPKRRIYTLELPLKHPWVMLRGIAQDVRAERGLAWRLFVRDISAAYHQTVLGYAWAFLPPLVAAGTFIFLQSQRSVYTEYQPTAGPDPHI